MNKVSSTDCQVSVAPGLLSVLANLPEFGVTVGLRG